jgi:hypothetical protein
MLVRVFGLSVLFGYLLRAQFGLVETLTITPPGDFDSYKPAGTADEKKPGNSVTVTITWTGGTGTRELTATVTPTKARGTCLNMGELNLPDYAIDAESATNKAESWAKGKPRPETWCPTMARRGLFA